MVLASNFEQLFVKCDDITAYSKVVDAYNESQIPVLGTMEEHYGLPPHIKLISYKQWKADKPSSASSSVSQCKMVSQCKICLASDDPICTTMGKFLAKATNRTFISIQKDNLASKLKKLLEKSDIKSLAFVIPSWNEMEKLDPSWVQLLLKHLRSNTFYEKLQDVSWGIMTSLSPSILSALVAKSILDQQFILLNKALSGAVIITESATSLGLDQPDISKSDEPLQIIDETYLQSNPANTVTEKQWSMLFFKGHGRSYCASKGNLCGARSIDLDPDTPINKCIRNMDCANPYDNAYEPGLFAFPRIDPRSYNARLMILDCCGSGGWAWQDKDTNIPSVSFITACGPASGVISSDFTCAEQPGDYLDVLSALWTEKTFGQVTSHINKSRTYAGTEFPY